MKLVPITDIFDIRYGNKFDISKMDILEGTQDGINFVNRSAENNGVSGIVGEYNGTEPYPAGLITVAMGGSVLSSFIQPKPFYSGQNVKILTPKTPLTEGQKIYYCAAIEANKFRYGTCGREANSTFIQLFVPSPEEIPESIRNYNLDEKFITKPVSPKKLTLDTKNWKWFRYEDIFDIHKGKRLTKANMIEGDTKYIGAIESNNGVTASIGNEEHVHKGNTLTVSYNGSIGNAFYQESEFWATDDVNVLYPKFSLNKYIGCLLITLIEKEKYRFSYGNKWDKETMRASKIKLPVTPTGSPDWQWMEEYIKSLPYSSSL